MHFRTFCEVSYPRLGARRLPSCWRRSKTAKRPSYLRAHSAPDLDEAAASRSTFPLRMSKDGPRRPRFQVPAARHFGTH